MKPFELGLVGLGKMGRNMALRMLEQGTINLHVYDLNKEARDEVMRRGGTAHESVDALVKGLWEPRKVIWMMLPAGKPSDDVFSELLEKLGEDDIIIDGGNANYQDTLRRAEEARKRGVHVIDAGVSGGLHGYQGGYGMMIGAEEEPFTYCQTVFAALGHPEGYARVGAPGSGHYVKMVHNAIEYGMMQSIAEGFSLLEQGRFSKELELSSIAHIWNNGTIISSFLMQMTERALREEDFSSLAACVDDSGEGRWAVHEAIDSGVPFQVNTAALYARKTSQGNADFANRLLSAIRNEFGGHPVKKDS